MPADRLLMLSVVLSSVKLVLFSLYITCPAKFVMQKESCLAVWSLNVMVSDDATGLGYSCHNVCVSCCVCTAVVVAVVSQNLTIQ